MDGIEEVKTNPFTSSLFQFHTKMPRYTAIYNAYLSFVIPKTVSEYLLEDDDARNDGKSVGSWWIRYGTFYYVDKDGNKQGIEHETAPDVDYKDPSGDTMIEDCDDGEDEE